MGEKKSFYAKLFAYLLKMLNKYYSCEAIPFEEKQEYEFVTQFHKDLQEVLEMGPYRVTAEIYRILCSSIQCRQLQYCSDPKKMLSEIWKIFSYWLGKPFDAKLQDEILETVGTFCDRWKNEEIAANLLVTFAGEVEEIRKQKKEVA